MSKSSELTNARIGKKDEFYTQYEDIEKEMEYHKDSFKDKIVYCNCDDPTWSAFWNYFHKNFKVLSLKKLISTHYEKDGASYKMVYKGGDDENINTGKITILEGNGGFQTEECIAILDETDIIVSNPPFSLFRDYVDILIGHNKKFLILGNMNALTYKNIFPLFRDNKMWYGASIHSGDRKFIVPDDYPLTASGCGVDENGQKYVKVKGIRWFTNIDYSTRYVDLSLNRTYSAENYPKYENCDAINVDKYKDIPYDYDGVMGVPITFIDHYNPRQFKILGLDKDFTSDKKRGIINGKQLYARVFIKNLHK